MTHFYLARKRRQLKYIAKKIRTLLTANGGQRNQEIDRLSAKLVKMVKRTKQLISRRELVKALGAASLLFGLAIANPAHAQNYAPPEDNPFNITPKGVISALTFGDLDGDGDIDMMANSYDSTTNNGFWYYENIGTAGGPDFAAPQQNPFGIQTQGSEFDCSTLGDLDDDGDLDMVTFQQYGLARYYENTGSPTTPQFGEPINGVPFGLDTIGYLAKPNLVDMDDDGDLDLLVGEYYAEDDNGNYFYGDFLYFENTGTPTAPLFTAPQRNPFGLTSTEYFNFASVADMDGDGDLDVISGEGYGNFNYFENTGTASNPQFAPSQLNPFGLELSNGSEDYIYIPTVVDLDSDGDSDVMVSGYELGFVYFENTVNHPVAIKELTASFDLEIFPNPVSSQLSIQTDQQLERIEIIDLMGRVVDQHLGVATTIGMGHLTSGVYMLRAIDTDGNIVLRKIEKD